MIFGVVIAGILYLVSLAALTVWAYRRRLSAKGGQEAEEYYLGGRSLGWVALVFTIVASQASAGTVVGSAALGAEWGWAWVLAVLFQLPSAFLFLGILGKKFAIIGRKLGTITIPEFLRHRYESSLVVILASLAILVFMTVYIMSQLVGGATVLHAATGISYETLVIVFGIVVALYTSIGGFRASVLTDVAQGFVLLLAAVAVWIAILVAFGGTERLGTATLTEAPELLTFPGPGEISIGMMLSFWVVFGFAAIGHPHVAVRCMSYRNTNSMHRAMTFGPIIMGILTLGFVSVGPVGAVLLDDPDVGDQMLPLVALEVMPTWLVGVILMALMAAVMSTVDAMLLVVSSTIVRDLYANYINDDASEQKVKRIGIVSTLVMGTIAVALALNPPEFFQTLVIYAASGLVVVFLVPVVLGLYWKRANALGAGASIVGGLVVFVGTDVWFGDTIAVDPVLPGIIVALLAFVTGSYCGQWPSRRSLIKFWGTNEAIRENETIGVSHNPAGPAAQ